MTIIEKLIAELEEGSGLYSVPGTLIDRVVCDVGVLNKQGIKTTPGKQSMHAWCVGVGGIMEPKLFVYGLTVRDALERAVKAFKKYKKARRHAYLHGNGSSR